MAASDEGRKVLLPVDQSENSLRAVKWFIKYGLKPNDHLILFHSIDTTHIIPSMGYTVAGLFASIYLSPLRLSQSLHCNCTSFILQP